MSLRNFRFVATLLVAYILSGSSAFAQNEGQLVEVIAVGVGMTQDEAHKAADVAAVRQVVGTMSDAMTLVENDELVEKKILTYSSGLIAESKIIGTPKKSANGLITLKVKATVKKTALRAKLVAAKLVSVAIDGESLWAQAVSAQDNLANAEAMIKDVLAKHTACVVAEPIPGRTGRSPLDYDAKTGEVFANVRVRIDQAKYTQFANEIVERIGPMATKKIKLRSTEDYGTYKGDGFFDYNYRYEDYPFLVMTSLRTGSAIAYQFEKSILNIILSNLDKGPLAVAVLLKDKQGSELSEAYRKLRTCSNYYYLTLFACSDDFGCVMPFYYAELNIVSSGVQCVGEERKGRSVGTFRISLGRFSPEELKAVGKLEIKVGHMKDEQFVECREASAASKKKRTVSKRATSR